MCRDGRSRPARQGCDVSGCAELADLCQRGGDTCGDVVDQLLHQCLSRRPVGVPVGNDHPLVDAPGRFDLDVLFVREQAQQVFALPVDEECFAGVQGAAGAVGPVTGTASTSERVAMDAASAVVERVAGELDDMEWVHHRDRCWDLFCGGGLEAGESVHRDHFETIPPVRGAFGQLGLEHPLRSAFDHVQQPGRSRLRADRSEVNDDGDVLIAVPGVSPDVFIDTERSDPTAPPGSSIRTRCPSARIALLAVCQETPRPAAALATRRWSITIASSAHRMPRRERFAGISAAAVRSSRQAPLQCEQR